MGSWQSSGKWLAITVGAPVAAALTIAVGDHFVQRATVAGYAAEAPAEAKALIQIEVPVSSLDDAPPGAISTFIGADVCPPGWEQLKLDDDGTPAFRAMGVFTDETGSLLNPRTGQPYSSYSIHIACTKR